jgi:hypothetical protein
LGGLCCVSYENGIAWLFAVPVIELEPLNVADIFSRNIELIIIHHMGNQSKIQSELGQLPTYVLPDVQMMLMSRHYYTTNVSNHEK